MRIRALEILGAFFDSLLGGNGKSFLKGLTYKTTLPGLVFLCCLYR